MNNLYYLKRVLAAIVAVVLCACAPKPASPPPTPTPNLPVVTLSIASVGDEARFDKPEMMVPAGTRVVLDFRNSTSRGERVMQNWVLVQPGQEEAVLKNAPNQTLADDFIARGDSRVIAFTTSVVGSQTSEVTFTAPAPGRYPYICTAPRHGAMRGVLIVQ